MNLVKQQIIWSPSAIRSGQLILTFTICEQARLLVIDPTCFLLNLNASCIPRRKFS